VEVGAATELEEGALPEPLVSGFGVVSPVVEVTLGDGAGEAVGEFSAFSSL
jgi:hypothetical protein